MSGTLAIPFKNSISSEQLYNLVMISPPLSDWKDLQRQVKIILQECGLNSETDKKIRTARGTVNIDVYAEDKAIIWMSGKEGGIYAIANIVSDPMPL